MTRRAWLLAALAGLLVLPLVALAATGKPVELPDPLTPEAIRELVARLSDEDVRRLLVTQLDRAATPVQAKREESGFARLAGEADLIRTRIRAMLGSAPRLPGELGAAVQRFSEGGRAGQLPLLLGSFALLVALAGVAESLVGRLLARVRRLGGEDDASGGVLTGRVVIGLVLDLVLLGVFAGVVIGSFLVFYQGHEPSRELFMAALVVAIEVRLAIIVARLLLAPATPAQRLVPVDDATAHALYRGAWKLAVLFGLADLVATFMRRWGVPPEASLLLSTIIRLAFLGVFLGLVWRHRAPFAASIRGPEPGPLRRLLAEGWPALMTAYVVVLFAALTLEQLAGRTLRSGVGIRSLLLVIGLPLVDRGLCRLLVEGRARGGYAPVLRNGVHIVVTAGGLLLLGRLWDVDPLALAARGVGTRFAGALIDVAVTLLLAHLVWQLARTAIDQRLARESGPRGVSDPGAVGGAANSRLATLLPLARGFIFVTICVMASMTALSALGVNIGPLLAGAGVVGVAVGFGAQTLVRDIISGAFYLMDDAFRLGEYIDVGGAKGTVERIGIRSMQLRHHRGALNIVPYGGIQRLNNQSRDWVIEKLEFRLSYDADITKVRKIIKAVGQELMDDPELGPQFLQPLKSQGVMAMEDSAMLVKAKFMARPGEQYVIRREAYQKLKQAFDAAGIQFAHRQVTVFVPPGAGPAASAAAGAAAAAAAEPPSAG